MPHKYWGKMNRALVLTIILLLHNIGTFTVAQEDEDDIVVPVQSLSSKRPAIVPLDTTKVVMKAGTDPRRRELVPTCIPPKVPCAESSFCYNPDTETCTSFGVCLIEYMPCVNSCIDSAELVCVENKAYCPKAKYLICGPNADCYNPRESFCYAGKTLCQRGEVVIDNKCTKLCDRPCYKTPCDETKEVLEGYEKKVSKLDPLDQMPAKLTELDQIILRQENDGKAADSKLAQLDDIISNLEKEKQKRPITTQPNLANQQCDYLCATVCYNPRESTCHPGYILCNKNDDFQGGKCVTKQPTSPCPSGQQGCGTNCYNTANQDCLNGNPVAKPAQCSAGQKPCGKTCYNIATENCLNIDGVYKPMICSNGLKYCGEECYFVAHQDCLNGKIVPKSPQIPVCSAGQKPCGKTCYNIATENCLNIDGVYKPMICSNGLKYCGEECYYIASQDCLNGKIVPKRPEGPVCSSGQQACGTICYDPANQVCNNGAVSVKPTTCVEPRKPCGQGCFNPNSHVCNTGDVVCRKSEELKNGQCQAKATPVCSGSMIPCFHTCIYPSEQVCNDGDVKCINPDLELHATNVGCFQRPKVCPPGQVLCKPGRECYTPATMNCFPGGIVCFAGEALCGRQCYEPKRLYCMGTTLTTHTVNPGTNIWSAGPSTYS